MEAYIARQEHLIPTNMQIFFIDQKGDPMDEDFDYAEDLKNLIMLLKKDLNDLMKFRIGGKQIMVIMGHSFKDDLACCRYLSYR